MDPLIWGPPFWGVLHTIAFNYPDYPTTIQKKIHHRLIHNLHEFLPNKTIATTFIKVLEKNPVTPYLDSKRDFIKWMHHIHNKINVRLDKPTISLADHYKEMNDFYKPKKKNYYPWILGCLLVIVLLLI